MAAPTLAEFLQGRVGGNGSLLRPPTGNMPPFPSTQHFDEANRTLNLTPQEQSLYVRHLQNLHGPGGVDNPDGSRSTLYQATITGPEGHAYAIPTVWDGRIVRDRNELVRNLDAAGGLGAFPSYGSVGEADDRYGRMHEFLERDTADYFRNRPSRGWRE